MPSIGNCDSSNLTQKLDHIVMMVRPETQRRLVVTACAFALFASVPVFAGDVSVTGFGTIGFVTSDKSYTYQRYISESGTFRRDSLAGIQFDATLADHIGATVQLLAAPSSNDDRSYVGNFSWAFLSWRPSNDFLIRIGRCQRRFKSDPLSAKSPK